jgi:hypothetical protein
MKELPASMLLIYFLQILHTEHYRIMWRHYVYSSLAIYKQQQKYGTYIEGIKPHYSGKFFQMHKGRKPLKNGIPACFTKPQDPLQEGTE